MIFNIFFNNIVLVLSVASFLDNHSQKCDPKAPQTFPSDMTNQLTTSEQENWYDLKKI